mmetsp:Transcript_30134/g.78096  ORF Transcript_30134/g.78096 Transcript_30134/m.78096 type:complete len:227 (+) Transcript_30134:277-957(+)
MCRCPQAQAHRGHLPELSRAKHATQLARAEEQGHRRRTRRRVLLRVPFHKLAARRVIGAAMEPALHLQRRLAVIEARPKVTLPAAQRQLEGPLLKLPLPPPASPSSHIQKCPGRRCCRSLSDHSTSACMAANLYGATLLRSVFAQRSLAYSLALAMPLAAVEVSRGLERQRVSLERRQPVTLNAPPKPASSEERLRTREHAGHCLSLGRTRPASPRPFPRAGRARH